MVMRKKRLLTDRSGDLQEQIIAKQSKRIADEVDAEVLRNMLCEIGWHQVIVPRPMTYEQSNELDQWLRDSIKGRHWDRGLVFLFEEERDAMWFKLRWLS
jgi:hypothetical protein